MVVIREEKLTPLIVHTGQFMGRSPKDRYFVKTKESEGIIDWESEGQSSPLLPIYFS